MRRGPIAAAAAMLALAIPATAQASYYITEQKAESLTREYLHGTLGYHYTAASCRPQGLSKAVPGYVYHRWACGWVGSDSHSSYDCIGQSVVSGSSDSAYFYWVVLHHQGECQYGWKAA